MTALAAFFAMIPTALALEKGSEANAPWPGPSLGGLLAGEPATLFVLPALYSLLVRDKKVKPEVRSRPTTRRKRDVDFAGKAVAMHVGLTAAPLGRNRTNRARLGSPTAPLNGPKVLT